MSSIIASICGCSDVPYTGPVLTVDYVDRYLNSTGEDTICLQDGFDTICLKLVDDDEEGDGPDQPPIVHIHPASIAFMFYYVDRPILRVKKVMDTSEVVQELVNSGRVQLPPDTEGIGNQDVIDSGEWTIEMYYPESFPEKDRGTTPATSGFDIRVGEGKELSASTKDDLVLMNFKQIRGPAGIPGVRFTVDSVKSELSIEVDGLIDGYTAKFYVKADSIVSEENIYSFQLQPNDDQ